MKLKSYLLTITFLVILSVKIHSALGQVTVPTNAIGSSDYVGSSNPNDVVFKANTTERMRIDESTGYIGIGTTGFTPSFALDVDQGDINVNTATNGYRIGSASSSQFVLWHNGDVSSIMVGVNAGNATMSGTNNTYVGNSAGLSTTGGTDNTIIGFEAGRSTAAGSGNTFVGS